MIDNQGNSTRYVGSHGQHPSQLNKPKSNKTFGWHRTLNEGEGHPGQTCAQAHSDMDHDDWLDQNPQMVMDLEEDCLGEDCGGEHYEEEMDMDEGKHWEFNSDDFYNSNLHYKKGKDAGFDLADDEEEEIEEVTAASSAGSFEGPLFGTMTEQQRIIKSIIREQYETLEKREAAFDPKWWDENSNEEQKEWGRGFLSTSDLKRYVGYLVDATEETTLGFPDTDEDAMIDIYSTKNWGVTTIFQASQVADYYQQLYGRRLEDDMTKAMKSYIGGKSDVTIDAIYDVIEELPWGLEELYVPSEESLKLDAQSEAFSIFIDMCSPDFYDDDRQDRCRYIWNREEYGGIKDIVYDNIDRGMEPLEAVTRALETLKNPDLDWDELLDAVIVQDDWEGDEPKAGVGEIGGGLNEQRILKSIIKEEISKKVSKQQLKESLKNRITRNILNEKDYLSGKLKYEKPTKLPGEIKNTPGMKQTDSTLKKSKSTNTEYLKHFDKKIKDYLDFENNSHPEFPHQNNSKTDYKSPMYRNTKEDEEFIDDFRGMGLEDANGVDMLDRVEDYLSGSKETGNAQTDKDGKALGNVVPNKTGERILKKVKRKKKEIDKRKSKMTNLRGYTPDVQTTTSLKESTEIEKIKHLFSYKDTTQ